MFSILFTPSELNVHDPVSTCDYIIITHLWRTVISNYSSNAAPSVQLSIAELTKFTDHVDM